MNEIIAGDAVNWPGPVLGSNQMISESILKGTGSKMRREAFAVCLS